MNRVKFDPKGEKIASFDEGLQEILQNDQRVFIDIKATGQEIVKVVVDAFKKQPELYEKAVISSFNPVTIYMVSSRLYNILSILKFTIKIHPRQIRKKDPRIVSGVAWRPRFFSTSKYSGLKGPFESRYNDVFKNILATLVDVVHDWALERITYYILGLSFILLHKDVINP